VLMRFHNRTEAGSMLAERLRRLAWPGPCVVLGLARGGLPVAAAIGAALQLPFDVMIVRKVGVPGYEELAMGAVASGDVEVRLPDVLAAYPGCAAAFPAAAATALKEVHRREQLYVRRGGRAAIEGATVILVDDGIATGATMLAGIRACRARGAQRVIVASPVVAQDTQPLLESEADGLIVLEAPAGFRAVGEWYEDFPQLEDADVIALLAAGTPASTPHAETPRSTHRPPSQLE